MPPDLLLECTACGSQAVWDTGAVPPVGLPEVGHAVRWFCQTCGREVRHTIVDLSVLIDKLHREICVATEIDRGTAERVMSQVYRHRRVACREILTLRLHAAQQVEDVAQAAGVSLEVVEQISVAEAAWMLRRGSIVEECPGDV